MQSANLMQVDAAPPPRAVRKEKQVADAPAEGGAAFTRPARHGGARHKRTEPPLRIDKQHTSFCSLDPACRVARAGQGRTYFNALCQAPIAPGARRTAKFVFSPFENLRGVVGMLPPGVARVDMQDWLGWQRESTAVWLDGTCRQDGKRLTGCTPAPNPSKGDTIVCRHEGTNLTVWREGGEGVLKAFANVPADWRFAAGAFGGTVRLMREHEDAGGQIPRVCITSIKAFKVPDGDMGAGRSDAFVSFLMVDEHGEPLVFPDGRPRSVHTETVDEASEEVEFPDSLAIPLPNGFQSGTLVVTLYDDDDNSEDDALGVASVAFAYSPTSLVFDKLTLQGQEQPGAFGFVFPDSEVSFKLDFLGAFT